TMSYSLRANSLNRATWGKGARYVFSSKNAQRPLLQAESSHHGHTKSFEKSVEQWWRALWRRPFGHGGALDRPLKGPLSHDRTNARKPHDIVLRPGGASHAVYLRRHDSFLLRTHLCPTSVGPSESNRVRA